MKEKKSCIHHTSSDCYLVTGEICCQVPAHLQVLASYPTGWHGQQFHNFAHNTWISCVTSFTLFSMPYRGPNALLSLPQDHTNLSSERLSPALAFFRNSLLPPSANKTVLTERGVNKLLTSAKQESFLHPKPRKKQCLSEQERGALPQKASLHSVIYFRV